MAFEIERKFLVSGDAWRGLAEPLRMRQGYVATKDGKTVRVRIVGDKAFLTLKDHAIGLVRHEFEYPIPVEDAETILNTMCGNLVEKYRYRVPAKEPGLVWGWMNTSVRTHRSSRRRSNCRTRRRLSSCRGGSTMRSRTTTAIRTTTSPSIRFRSGVREGK